MKHIFSINLLIHGGLAMANLPSMCLYNPVELVAGLDLAAMSARTAYPLSEPCTATIDFDDRDFLPITYTFKPISCDGPELVQFTVPLGAPSGEAYITWRCASEFLMCGRALILGGQSDRSLNLQVDGHEGQVICEGGYTLTTTTPGSSTLTTVVTKRLTKPRTVPTELTTTPTKLATTPTSGGFLGDKETSGAYAPDRTSVITTTDVTSVVTDATATSGTPVTTKAATTTEFSTTDTRAATDTFTANETTGTAVASGVTRDPIVF
ncbi:hypothetical protein B0T10DRAFT_467139 [Thelonectria olida]|uniref:Uncharacterized protein n=1 Tax=Thelonectria olida TaxID=1576542 RepID=A0A9P9AHX8_9HYPO|nr:hypothetical protein B0T10DRAFT_467139 [Thelonectria olida]